MAGYSGFSKSTNAVIAEEQGRFPASTIAAELKRGVTAAAVRKLCRWSEWHHCSSRYNKVYFYDLEECRAFFDSPVGRKKLAAFRAAEKKAAQRRIYTGCTVFWLEWSGTRKRPVCEEMQAKNCQVEISGQTARVKYIQRWKTRDGKRRQRTIKLVKRLTTRGFEIRNKEGEIIS